MDRYLIIVSRDQPWLVETLTSSYSEEGEVEIHVDRREPEQFSASRGCGGERRSTSLITDLHTQGFMVIQQS